MVEIAYRVMELSIYSKHIVIFFSASKKKTISKAVIPYMVF